MKSKEMRDKYFFYTLGSTIAYSMFKKPMEMLVQTVFIFHIYIYIYIYSLYLRKRNNYRVPIVNVLTK
jgi:lipoprotein signal peptidase